MKESGRKRKEKLTKRIQKTLKKAQVICIGIQCERAGRVVR